MTWSCVPPDGRVFALIECEHHAAGGFAVAQFDPGTREWLFYSDAGKLVSLPGYTLWHRLPRVFWADDRTHAMVKR